MSLINQMLKDLESRQQGGAPHQATAVPGTGGAPRRPRLLLLGGLLAALSIAALLVWRFVPATGGAPSVAIEKSAEPAVSRKFAAVPVPNTVPAEIPSAASREAAALPLSQAVALQAVRLREFDTFIHFEADFDRPPIYHIAVAQDRSSLQVNLAAVELAAGLPVIAGQRWLAKLQPRQRQDGLLLELMLQPAVRIRNYSATVQVAGAGYRLLLDLYPEAQPPAVAPLQLPASKTGAEDAAPESETVARPPQPPAAPEMASAAEPAPARPLRRTVREPSAAELAEQDYRRAQAALAAGRLRQGEGMLLLALERHPGHLPARQALVAALLRQQRQGEAGRLLAEGLHLYPEHLPLRLRYAELLMTQGAAEKARDLLLDGPQPSPAAAPQLHALLGALFQRLGQYQAAAHKYQALLATRPDNGLWHMGLAIAHEHTGAPEQAVRAYRAALSGQGLSPELQSYVRMRLAALRP